jgi:hypothetical protein
MLETFTIAISLGSLGLVAGAFVPAGVGYAILFLRQHGIHLRTFLSLGGRLLAAILVFGGIFSLVLMVTKLLGGSGEVENDLEFISYVVGGQIGFWGSIVAFVIGFRRGRTDRGATQDRVSQS